MKELIKSNIIFVFGSNRQGIHGRGAALEAKQKWGALQGRGIGYVGNSYAIPTKETPQESLSLDRINDYVHDFIYFAEQREYKTFLMTRVGCGLAGYDDGDIAPMFDKSPPNVFMPKEWRQFLGNQRFLYLDWTL